jgi:AcrR family transcriptional regulator
MSQSSFEESLLRYVEELKNEEEMTEKQKQILQASIKLFATKGFHASSTAEIAREAGVAEGTIFRHYKSKKDILLAVVAPVLVKFAAPFVLKDVRAILAAQENKTFAQTITELYRNRLELLEANEKHFRIILQEAFFHEEIREALVSSIFQEARKMALPLIEARMASGELRQLPAETVFRMVISAMVGLLLFKYVLTPDEFKQRTDEEQIALTVDVLINGIANRE